MLNNDNCQEATALAPCSRNVAMSVLLRDPINAILTPERKSVLEKLFAGIGSLTTLPSAAQRILQLTEDETADPNKLREAIQTDPVLVARILRRLNSAYYSLSHRVADIRTAVSLLGIQEIRNLALTVYVSRMFERKGDHGTYRRKDLWNHCVAVAAASRLVARVCGLQIAEEVYIAGLLHDLGMILLDQSMRKHFCRVVDEITPATPAYLIEQRTLTFDHATLGGFVAKKWNFPDQIADAIAYHHEPLLYHGEHKTIVYVVAIANYLCSRAGITSLGVHNLPPPPDEVYAGVGLDQVALAIIWDQLEETLEKAESLAVG